MNTTPFTSYYWNLHKAKSLLRAVLLAISMPALYANEFKMPEEEKQAELEYASKIYGQEAVAYDHNYTILFLGNSGCGKTTTLTRMALEQFEEKMVSTLKPDYIKYGLKLAHKKVCFKMWDVGGFPMQLYKKLRELPFRADHIDCIVLFYDVTDLNTLKECEQNWLPEVKENCKSVPSLLLCGNKCDVDDQEKEVFAANVEGVETACRLSNLFRDIKSIEISAKTGQNIKEFICMIALAPLNYEPTIYNNLTVKPGDLVYVDIDGNTRKARILEAKLMALEVLVLASSTQAEYKRRIEPKQLRSPFQTVDYYNRGSYEKALSARQDESTCRIL